MRRLLVVIALLGIVAACGAAPAASVPTPSPLPPTPLPTPTPISLTDIDLEPLLIQDGDLPAGLSGAQVRSTPPNMFRDITGAANQIHQQFARDGNSAGGVAVFLFEETADRDQAYAVILDGFGDTIEAVDVGEQGSATPPTTSMINQGLNSYDLLFSRCAAVAHIRMSGEFMDINMITAYAERLDQRLTEAVC